MIPVVTTEEMAAIDADAAVSEDVLVDRAGWAVARSAKRMLGGLYGRRVVVVAGKGNNGADGRVAGRLLANRGVHVVVVAPGVELLPACDLVIDAAFGTGFRGEYSAPLAGNVPVLAVDIPSGVDGNTGVACESAVKAAKTVTFAALKPGLLFGSGAVLAGEVELADIGLDVSAASCHMVETSDVLEWLPKRPRDGHKWQTSSLVIAGSQGMLGAAVLCAHGASRAGSGMVHLAVPGIEANDIPPSQVITHVLSSKDWESDVLALQDRMKVLIIGPGLGRAEETRRAILRVVEQARVPVVVDADALAALSDDLGVLDKRSAPTVLTPHDGEYEKLMGSAVGDDRIGAARALASQTQAIVLLKGSTTTIAHPDGDVLLATQGDGRLATAGTGDVLSGVIGAFIARGMDPFRAAAAGAHVHGAAARMNPEQVSFSALRGPICSLARLDEGLVATDLPLRIAEYLSAILTK